MFSFPFRLGRDGSIATVEQNSDVEIEEALAVAMLTHPGERIQVPTFGVADPAFSGFEVGALQRHCLDFGPDVEITAVDVRRLDDGQYGDREEVLIHWHRRGDRPARTGGVL